MSRFPVQTGVAAGRLRHRVNIEQAVETRTATGGVQRSWTTFASNVAAEIIFGKAKEPFVSGQEQHWIFATITIRAIAGITTKMRVNHNGTTYDITGILRDPSQQSYIDLWCLEGLSQG